MVRTLDRYFVRQVVVPFCIVLLVFTFMLWMDPIMRVAEPLIAKGVDWSTVGRILVLLLPQALALTIPMSLLIGLLIAFGRLSEDREWVALQACGVSAYRLLWPLALLSLVAWAATSYMIIVALPSSNQSYREIEYTIVASRAESEVRPHVFYDDFPSQKLYVRDTQPRGAGWKDVFLADVTRPEAPVVFVAREGRMIVDRDKRTVAVQLSGGTRHAIEPPDKYQALQFIGDLTLQLDPRSVFPSGKLQKGDNELTLGELRQRVEEFRQRGDSPHNWIMKIHQKFAIPLACFVFALIALPLGLTNRRDGKLASFVVGIAVIFVYYIIMYSAEAMVKGKLMPAWLAEWLPHVTLVPVGLYLLVRRGRPGESRWRVPLPFLSRTPAAGMAAGGPEGQEPPPRRRVVLVVRVPRLSSAAGTRLRGIARAAREWTPSLLDWYVGKRYLRVFFVAVFALLGIFYLAEFIDLQEKLFKGLATLPMLMRYFRLATPRYLYFVIPIAGLLATLVTIGILTKNSELVVMKACGVSLYRAALPMLVFGAVLTGIVFLIQEEVMPASNYQAEELRNRMRGGTARTFDVLNRRWIVGRQGQIYHYVYYDPRRRELNQLSIYEFDVQSWRLSRRTHVARAVWDPASSEKQPRWSATDGWVREFRAGGADVGEYSTFQTKTLALEAPDYFGTEQPDSERMNYVQLKKYIGYLRAGGFDVTKPEVALQQKLAFPFIPLIMTLIAIPFAVTTGRRGALYGIGIGIVLAMVYWISSQVFAAIGSGGLVVPLLAAWAPNILFAGSAAYLLLTVRT